jgi:hypothetical protein
MRQILIEVRFPGHGEEHGDAFDGIDGGLDHGGGVVASLQVGEVYRHQLLASLT